MPVQFNAFKLNPTPHNQRNTFFDGPVDVQRFDSVRYPVFRTIFEQQRERFWFPNEFNFSRDQQDMKTKMTPAMKHMLKSNVLRQTMLDSIQGRSPLEVFGPICSLPEVENCLNIINFVEGGIHSESYTHQIRGLYSSPAKILNELPEISEIINAADSISHYYDALANFDGKYGSYDHKRVYWKCLHAWNALEAIRFYVSFATNWSFYQHQGIMQESALMNQSIAQDEELHRKFTTELKRVNLKEDDDFVKLEGELKEELEQIFVDVIEQEIQWVDYLFKEGSVLGITPELLKEYVRWLGTSRMSAVGLKSPYKVQRSNPLPWTSEFIHTNNRQDAPQEATSTAYLLGGVVHDVQKGTPFLDFDY